VYSFEYTKIPNVFLTPHDGWWRHQIASLITTAQMSYGPISFLLERNNKFNNGTKSNNGIQDHCCDNVIRGHCEFIITSVPSVATVCSNSHHDSHCCNYVFQLTWFSLQQCSDNDLGYHCCHNVLQQPNLFPLLQLFQVTLFSIVATMCFNNDPRSCGLPSPY
jgi:hypothetical protein